MAFLSSSSSNFSLPTLALALLALLIIYLVVSAYLNYRSYSQFKGPFLASISGLWLFKVVWQGRMYAACVDALETYGSPVRIAPNKIMTDDPVILRHMSAPRSNFRRGTFYDGMSLDPNINNVISERDEKLHNTLRAKMIRGYSGRDIPGLEANIDARILDLVSLIRRECAGGNQPVDFARYAQYFTLDVLTHIAFGAPFGYLTQNKDIYSYIATTTAFLQILECGTNFPVIHRLLSSRPMQALFAPKPTDRIGMGAMLGVAKRVVGERYGPDAKDYPDMLGSFVRNGLTQQEAESESMLQILGGSDSTATAIRMTLLYILTNPVVYAKLMHELGANRANISTPVITSAEARQLPYLQACIKEGLRMWPPISSLQSKIAPPGGETVNGVFLPAGVEVAVSQVATHRRKDVYGDDANVYRPDRWIDAGRLDDGGERLNTMERTLELVFGSGRFGCLGKYVAMIELDKIFVALLSAFELGIVDPLRPMQSVCWGIHVQNAFWLSARERREEMTGK